MDVGRRFKTFLLGNTYSPVLQYASLRKVNFILPTKYGIPQKFIQVWLLSWVITQWSPERSGDVSTMHVYTPVNCYIAMENPTFWWSLPWKDEDFHGYVSLGRVYLDFIFWACCELTITRLTSKSSKMTVGMVILKDIVENDHCLESSRDIGLKRCCICASFRMYTPENSYVP